MHKLPYSTLKNGLFKELHFFLITVNKIFMIKIVIYQNSLVLRSYQKSYQYFCYDAGCLS